MRRRTNSTQPSEGGSTQYDGPSKSARKREATAAQALGERLIEMSESQLAALSLSEELRQAIRDARGMRGRGSNARQRQYIGRLMREVDTAPILQQLEIGTRAQALDSARFRRVESWRDRLVADGDAALAALGESFPLTQELQEKLRATLLRAQNSTSDTVRTTARRELFRELRAILANDPA